jgi:hypothetical protein
VPAPDLAEKTKTKKIEQNVETGWLENAKEKTNKIKHSIDNVWWAGKLVLE